MTKLETINLEPNYPAVFANFARALPGEADRLLNQLQRGLRPEDAPPADTLAEIPLSDLWEHSEQTFRAFHGWLAPLVIALASTTKVDEVEKLREHLQAFLEKVSNVSRNRF